MTKPTQWPCKGCGETLAGRGGKRYCGPDCRPRCRIPECRKPVHTKALCSTHARRAARYGDPLTELLRQKNLGPCSVAGCDSPMRKRAWCASHYSQWKRLGKVGPFSFKWADLERCLICDKPNGQHRSRKFCSAACQQVFVRHGGAPMNPTCARCGSVIDLMTTGKDGRRKRSDARLCAKCKSHSRTDATPLELAERDGAYCQLCGCDVDMLATFPDPMRPSVDHILPRSWGGSDAASNNQLTHLLCNQVKSDRYEGVSSRSRKSP